MSMSYLLLNEFETNSPSDQQIVAELSDNLSHNFFMSVYDYYVNLCGKQILTKAYCFPNL